MTPVKDQYACGSCYSFAATAVTEYHNRKLGGNLTLSQQNLIDCDTSTFGCKNSSYFSGKFLHFLTQVTAAGQQILFSTFETKESRVNLHTFMKLKFRNAEKIPFRRFIKSKMYANLRSKMMKKSWKSWSRKLDRKWWFHFVGDFHKTFVLQCRWRYSSHRRTVQLQWWSVLWSNLWQQRV